MIKNPYHFRTIIEMLRYLESRNYQNIFMQMVENAIVKAQIYETVNTSTMLISKTPMDLEKENIQSAEEMAECFSQLVCDEVDPSSLIFPGFKMKPQDI